MTDLRAAMEVMALVAMIDARIDAEASRSVKGGLATSVDVQRLVGALRVVPPERAPVREG